MGKAKVSKRSLYLQILDLLRIYNQKDRFVFSGYKPEHSMLEIFCVSEIANRPEIGVGELSALMGVHKSKISRTISTLEQKGLVKKARKRGDRREKRLELLPPAIKMLAFQDSHNHDQVNAFSKNVTFEEARQLDSYMKVLADGSGSPELVLRSTEPGLMLQIRRMTYDHGVLSGDYLGSGYDVSTWQLLTETRDFGEQLRISELARKFSVPLNTLSQRLRAAEQAKLIERIACKHDKREKRLKLLRKGEEALATIESTAHEYFKHALRSLSKAEVEDFVSLYRKYIGPAPQFGDVIVSTSTVIRAMENSEERLAARQYAMTQVMRGAYTDYLPEYLCASDSLVLGVFVSDEQQGVIEFTNTKKDIALRNCILNVADEVAAGRERVLELALSEFAGQIKSISVPTGLLDEQLMGVLESTVPRVVNTAP